MVSIVAEMALSSVDSCFTAFDKDNDDRLSVSEFEQVCNALFRNDHVHVLPQGRLGQIFAVFDKNNDKYIDRQEFQYCWNNWIQTILRPKSAFLVVDMQNDFISGSLAMCKCSAQQDAVQIISPINEIIATVKFNRIFYSLDWHPIDHVSFIENIGKRPLHESSPFDASTADINDTVIFAGPPPMKQRMWPRHCVQDSWGAELHKDLTVQAENSEHIYKGCDPDVDSYSMFWDNLKLSGTGLHEQLKRGGITDVYVCGIAYDLCVDATATDALSVGYRTILIDDCCRGVDLNNISSTKQKFMSSGGLIVNANEVKAMVEGIDRRLELGFQLAMNLVDTQL